MTLKLLKPSYQLNDSPYLMEQAQQSLNSVKTGTLNENQTEPAERCSARFDISPTLSPT